MLAEGFEQSSATLRWSVAQCGLDRIDTLVSQIPPAPP